MVVTPEFSLFLSVRPGVCAVTDETGHRLPRFSTRLLPVYPKPSDSRGQSNAATLINGIALLMPGTDSLKKQKDVIAKAVAKQRGIE